MVIRRKATYHCLTLLIVLLPVFGFRVVVFIVLTIDGRYPGMGVPAG